MTSVVRVITVSTVHKHMQQWTQEQQYVRKKTEDMRSMFRNQKEGGNNQKGNHG